MEEFALALLAMTASHHRWPLKPPLEPAAIVRAAPVQTRHVDLRGRSSLTSSVRPGVDLACPD